MTVLLLPRLMTPRERAEYRASLLTDPADRDLFLRWFETGRSDAAAGADLEAAWWWDLLAAGAPPCALAGWLEGVAAHRALVDVERRLRAVMV